MCEVNCGGFHFSVPLLFLLFFGNPILFLWLFRSFWAHRIRLYKGPVFERHWTVQIPLLLVKGTVQGMVFEWYTSCSNRGLFRKELRNKFNTIQIPVLLKGAVIEQVFDKGTVQWRSNTGPFGPTSFVLGLFRTIPRTSPFRSVPLHCTEIWIPPQLTRYYHLRVQPLLLFKYTSVS